MKINKNGILIIFAGLVIFQFQCKKSSNEDFMMDFSKKYCYKIADCSAELLKEMPESDRKEIAHTFPSREKCDSEIEKERQEKSNDASKPGDFIITEKERSVGENCLKELEQTKCGEFHVRTPACVEFNNLVKSKSGQ